jgi:hypothetical protein
MMQCEWSGCSNDTTKIVYRLATEEEQEQGRVVTERG